MNVTATDFRRAHLIRMIEGHGTADHFSEMVGLAPSYISQLTTGRRNVGPRTARKIEAALGLSVGFMDVPPAGHDLDREITRMLAELPEPEAVRLIAEAVPSLSDEGVRQLTSALLSRLTREPKT